MYPLCVQGIHQTDLKVSDGVDDFLPLPGSPGPGGSVKYKQIAGEPVTFDADSGARNNSPASGSAAVFVLKGGAYFCMLAESDGEAALFDAPEGDKDTRRVL